MSEKHNLIKAIERNDWTQITELLEKDNKLFKLNILDSNMKWIHKIANGTKDCLQTEEEIIKLYYRFDDYIDLEVRNESGATPLLLSVLNGKFYQTRAFLKLGSDISTRDYYNIGLRDKCCKSDVANMKNKKKILDLLDNHPPKYVPHTDIRYHFDKLELCEDEPDEPVVDD